MTRWVLGASVSVLALMSAVPSRAVETGDADATHSQPSEEIVVTAPFQRNRADVLSSVTVLTGTELTREIRSTIGETLARQPGVSATSFGPNASRPILRGFQGERVRVLSDGIGSFDVSNTSVDHAVAVNPLFASRIEVLRGPAALLFGSSASGGVVNVLDTRIPRAVPAEALHFDEIATYGSAANERSVAGSADVPVGTRLVLHADGSYAKSGNLDIGGYVLSADQRDDALAAATVALGAGNAARASELRRVAGLKDELPNSGGRTTNYGAGASVITETGNLGFVISRYDSLYGVPERYSLDPVEQGEGPVRLDVKQTRADARAEIDTGGGFLDSIKLRAGYADYQHQEIDESGAVGTTFLNKSGEGRLEFAQAKRGALKGAFGAQYFYRDFAAIGDEAFLPRNETMQAGLFTLQQLDLGKLEVEAGARLEHTDANASLIGAFRNFTTISGSLGGAYAVAEGWKLGLNLSHTERAPAAEELFANGPHAGTQAFEIGDPNFRKETSNGAELTLRGKGDGYSFEAAGYYTRFRNYVYESQTGAVEDDLPVFQFLQDKARYWGLEAQGTVTLGQAGGFEIAADALGDYVHATIPGVGAVPRIPPLRLLGGLSATSDKIDGRIEVEHAFKQDRVAAFETETGGFTLFNASASFRPFEGQPSIQLVLSANNLLDVTARRHASFLKDFAPLAGRDFRASVRVTF